MIAKILNVSSTNPQPFEAFSTTTQTSLPFINIVSDIANTPCDQSMCLIKQVVEVDVLRRPSRQPWIRFDTPPCVSEASQKGSISKEHILTHFYIGPFVRLNQEDVFAHTNMPFQLTRG